MRLDLEGCRGLVTGGSKGLGEAIARELVSEGARVAICSRNEREVTATAEEVGAEYAQAADVTDAEQVRDLIARTADALGGIDFLVNNAGGAHPGTFETLSDADWVADLDVKLFSLIRCSREVLPHLRAAGGGRIVNIGAVYSRYPDPTFFATSVNRAAGNSFTKTLTHHRRIDRRRRWYGQIRLAAYRRLEAAPVLRAPRALQVGIWDRVRKALPGSSWRVPGWAPSSACGAGRG